MADIPRGASTNASIDLGGSLRSKIDTFGDRDWIRVDVKKGDWIQVDLKGRGTDPLEDAFLRIYDADRKLVTEDDDNGAGTNSQATFKATQNGHYFIEAGGYDGDYKGQYVVKAEKVATPKAEQPLYWGTQMDDTNVTVYFADDGEEFRTGPGFGRMTSEGWNAYEIAQFEAAFALIEAVSGLTFTITTDSANADLKLLLDTDEFGNDGTLGFFNPPGESRAGVGVFNGTEWSRTSGGDLDLGGTGFVTIVHELLHGLGLAHPHDDGGGSTVMAGVTDSFDDYGDFDLNQGVFTTMTYNSGYFTGSTGSTPAGSGNYGTEAGPMALDIAVLQALYGVNPNHKAGNSTYQLANENAAGTMWQAIWDTDGTDAITYDGARDTTIDLRAATLVPGVGAGGYVSSAKGIAGGFTIAKGVKIEKAFSDQGDDTLIGNGIGNVLSAGNGDDTLKGNGGADTLKAGKGWDTLNGGNGHDGLEGGAGRDRLSGGNGNDALAGATGDDTLKGGAGRDTLLGGADFDVLRGGNGADVLKGGAKADLLQGGGGADTLTGGGGQDDFKFAGAGDSKAGAANRDVITDFGNGLDLIILKPIDADATKGGNQAFAFIGTANFSDAGQLRVVAQNGDRLVQADRDGDGQADLEILLQDARGINANDFIL